MTIITILFIFIFTLLSSAFCFSSSSSAAFELTQHSTWTLLLTHFTRLRPSPCSRSCAHRLLWECRVCSLSDTTEQSPHKKKELWGAHQRRVNCRKRRRDIFKHIKNYIDLIWLIVVCLLWVAAVRSRCVLALLFFVKLKRPTSHEE